MGKEIKVVKVTFADQAGFRMYLNFTQDGNFEIKTYLSRELLGEIKQNEGVKNMLKEDYLILLQRGVEALGEAEGGAG